jgi:hypothetical protein
MAKFDTLLILARLPTGGNVAYFGPTAEAPTFFGDLCGLPIPPLMSPANHYIDIVTPVRETGKDGTQQVFNMERIEHIVAQFDTHLRPALDAHLKQRERESFPTHFDARKTKFGDANVKPDFHVVMPARISVWREFVVLLHMHTLLLLRNPRTSVTRLVQAALLSLIGGLIYLNLDNTQSGLLNRVSCLFFLLNQVFMGSIMSVLFILPQDRPIFLREHSNNRYGAFSYWNAKSLIEVPFDCAMAFIYTIISYWMIGLQPGYHYAIYLGTFVLLANAASSIGFAVSAGVKEQATAMVITPIVLIPLMVFGGFFIQSGSIPVFLDWIKVSDCVD